MNPKPRLNAAWHKANPMPPKATTEQRITWHLAHREHCACAPIPPKLLELIRAARRG